MSVVCGHLVNQSVIPQALSPRGPGSNPKEICIWEVLCQAESPEIPNRLCVKLLELSTKETDSVCLKMFRNFQEVAAFVYKVLLRAGISDNESVFPLWRLWFILVLLISNTSTQYTTKALHGGCSPANVFPHLLWRKCLSKSIVFFNDHQTNVCFSQSSNYRKQAPPPPFYSPFYRFLDNANTRAMHKIKALQFKKQFSLS